MSKYAHLDRDALIGLLERRDAQRQLGLVWEREEIEADAALNDDYVAGLPSEIDKAGARHAEYGDVFMVGRPRGASEFVYLRELGGKLDNGGGFDVARMRW